MKQSFSPTVMEQSILADGDGAVDLADGRVQAIATGASWSAIRLTAMVRAPPARSASVA